MHEFIFQTSQKDVLKHVCSQNRIQFSEQPDSDLSHCPYLIRADCNLNHLFNKAPFLPNSGQYFTWGVFLGGCFNSLMYPHDGLYYVFSRCSILPDNFLVDPSPEFDELINSTAQQKKLDLKSYNDYFEAARYMYEKHNIYQSKNGVITIHTEIPVESAVYIFAPQSIFKIGEKIPHEFENHIIMF
jgi:hypothetical protein